MFIILYKGQVFHNTFFHSTKLARNYLKFKFSSRNFKEPVNNTFVCTRYGTKLEIIQLESFKNI
jgi:hypothetical protein